MVWHINGSNFRSWYFHCEILGLGLTGLGIYRGMLWYGHAFDHTRRDFGGHNKSKSVSKQLLGRHLCARSSTNHGKHFRFLNIITELIAGYAWPGKPIANMMVKCYGYNSVKHGMDFAQDLKLGQYMVCRA